MELSFGSLRGLHSDLRAEQNLSYSDAMKYESLVHPLVRSSYVWLIGDLGYLERSNGRHAAGYGGVYSFCGV